MTTPQTNSATLPAPSVLIDIPALEAAGKAARKAAAILYLLAAHGGLPAQSSVAGFYAVAS